MSVHRAALSIVCAFACTGALATTPALAQPASPAPGYSGTGTLVVQTAIGGAKIAIGGDVAFEYRDPLVRVDVLSLGIPGTDPAISALASTQLFPPGGFTIVYDRSSARYVVWSNAKRAYFEPPPKDDRSPSAPPAGAPSTRRDPLEPLLAFANDLRLDRAFSLSLSLAGHSQVDGHPATGLSFAYLLSDRAGATTNVHGTIQLADDLGELPVQVLASVATPSIPQSELRLDVSRISVRDLADTEFSPPAGYVRASALADVVGRALP